MSAGERSPDVDLASKSDLLWHEMREDLRTVTGAPVEADRLRCCVCGRLLPRADFSLEHVVPRQALADDPAFVRASVSASKRSGHLLLCRKPVRFGNRTWAGGCNGWKGRFYDASLRGLMNRSVLDGRRTPTERVTLAGFAVGYLAMVVLFGYRVAFTPEGILARRQFFSPDRFLRDVPLMCQVVLAGSAPDPGPETLPFWSNPFSCDVQEGRCFVVVRNFSVIMPVGRDPRLPVPRHLVFVPGRYALRPDFTSVVG